MASPSERFNALLAPTRHKGHEIPVQTRAAIISAVIAGEPKAQVARRYGVSRSGVSALLQRVWATGSLSSAPRSGRPKRRSTEASPRRAPRQDVNCNNSAAKRRQDHGTSSRDNDQGHCQLDGSNNRSSIAHTSMDTSSLIARPSRRRLVGISTKMYFSISRTREFLHRFLTHLAAIPPGQLANLDIFIIPDFITLAETVNMLERSSLPIMTGAQDCHWEDDGAYTGEVSPAVLRESGARLVEVGHAERRKLFGEDDALIALKAAAASRNGLIPLVCIGERTRGDVLVAVEECRGQLEAILGAIAADAEVILAYEPVWAIGASEPAAPDHITGVVDGIRTLHCVRKRLPSTRIVYGGSAGPGLFAQLSDHLDGLFLGRFAHDPEMFVQTIKEVNRA